MGEERHGVIWVLGAAFLFSTVGTAQHLLGAGSTPLGVGAGRLLVGSLVLLLLLPRAGSSPRDLPNLWRKPATLVASAAAAAFQACFFAGVKWTGVALGTLIVVGSAPVFTGVLGRIFLGSRPTRTWFAATAACLTGLTLLSLSGIEAGSPAGVGASLGAGFAIATYTVAAKRLLDDGVHHVPVMASTFLLGTLLLVPLVATQALGWVATPRGLLLVGYLGIFTMAGANWLMMRGLRLLPAAAVSTLMLAEPLLATVLGVVVLGERLEARGVVGVALVVGGLALQARGVGRRVGVTAEPARTAPPR